MHTTVCDFSLSSARLIQSKIYQNSVFLRPRILQPNLSLLSTLLLPSFLSITNKMQCCIILFINVNALQVSSGFSAHHQELKSVHAASGICQTCLLLLLAVAAKKFETCTASTWIKSIIQHCILLVLLKNTLMMHGPMNVKSCFILSNQNPVHIPLFSHPCHMPHPSYPTSCDLPHNIWL
jgi:hypothetical protein